MQELHARVEQSRQRAFPVRDYQQPSAPGSHAVVAALESYLRCASVAVQISAAHRVGVPGRAAELTRPGGQRLCGRLNRNPDGTFTWGIGVEAVQAARPG